MQESVYSSINGSVESTNRIVYVTQQKSEILSKQFTGESCGERNLLPWFTEHESEDLAFGR